MLHCCLLCLFARHTSESREELDLCRARETLTRRSFTPMPRLTACKAPSLLELTPTSSGGLIHLVLGAWLRVSGCLTDNTILLAQRTALSSPSEHSSIATEQSATVATMALSSKYIFNCTSNRTWTPLTILIDSLPKHPPAHRRLSISTPQSGIERVQRENQSRSGKQAPPSLPTTNHRHPTNQPQS